MTLPIGESGCLALAPAGLVVTRAEATARLDPHGDLEVLFRLDGDDTDTLNRLLQGRLGARVAMVFAGRVLSAPQIQTPSFGGRGVISDLDLQAAADVVAALSG